MMNIEVVKRNSVRLLRFSNEFSKFNSINQSFLCNFNGLLNDFNNDDSVKCLILTGNSKSFFVGLDVNEFKNKNFSDLYSSDYLSDFHFINQFRKPIIGALNGYALGGGLELAMACDILVASHNSRLGQPEINLGIIPGGGATQRLIRAVGKSKAMELILTGNHIDSNEALKLGLVSHVTDEDNLLPLAYELAENIAGKSSITLQIAKEAINAANELPLNQGLTFERRLFHQCFSTNDQNEGLNAFIEKRKPNFSNN